MLINLNSEHISYTAWNVKLTFLLFSGKANRKGEGRKQTEKRHGEREAEKEVGERHRGEGRNE